MFTSHQAFTHYSFFYQEKTIADFAPVPAGGLPSLLADLHALDSASLRCCEYPKVCLHPHGEQISFTLRQASLILFTPCALKDQAVELLAEGNHAGPLALHAYESTLTV